MSTGIEGGDQVSKRKALNYCLCILKHSGYINENVTLEQKWFDNDTSFPYQDFSCSSQTIVGDPLERLPLTSFCSKKKNIFLPIYDSPTISLQEKSVVTPPWKIASLLQHVRHEAIQEFVERFNPTTLFSGSEDPSLHNKKRSFMDIVEWKDNMSSLSFKYNFVYRNIPCIIKGLDQREFLNISNLWTKNKEDSHKDYTTRTHSEINTTWFLTQLGETTLVPIRHNFTPTDLPTKTHHLDTDGRANECQTTFSTMKAWVTRMQLNQNNATVHDDRSQDIDPNIYLKDWHLQQYYESLNHNQSLYTTPDVFQHDLLNGYFTQFTEGDYRFVYWGPTGSKTYLHSDVMNSLSWSYNVIGEKEWTFYIPQQHSDINAVNHIDSFKVIQSSGETVFVPAGWKHEVRNLMETISINHNWIVPVSLDLTWKCMLDEVQAVEHEMVSWGMDSYEARERMLLGCFGLDVSSFFLMILVGMIHQMSKLDLLSMQKKGDCSFNVCISHTWESWFDLGCMISILNELDMDSVTVDNITNLPRRLEVAFGDGTMASNALHLFLLLRSICYKYYGASEKKKP